MEFHSPTEAWVTFSWLHAFGVFVGYFVLDILWAWYMLAVTERRAAASANVCGAIYVLSALGVMSYAGNWLYLLPLALGSWSGTYLIVSHERRKKDETPETDT
jgi:hypothetical protein